MKHSLCPLDGHFLPARLRNRSIDPNDYMFRSAAAQMVQPQSLRSLNYRGPNILGHLLDIPVL